MSIRTLLQEEWQKSDFSDNAPTPEAAPVTEQQKNIVIFHNESIFTVNDDQKTQWGTKDMQVIKPKGKGTGIMASDFVDEQN